MNNQKIFMKITLSVLIIIFTFQSVSMTDDKNWLIEKANEGDPIAQNNVGYNYLYGLNGFSEDLEMPSSSKRPKIFLGLFILLFNEFLSVINL